MAGIDGFSDRDFERAEEAWSALDESLANASDSVDVLIDSNGRAYLAINNDERQWLMYPDAARKLLGRLAGALSTIDAHERAAAQKVEAA